MQKRAIRMSVVATQDEEYDIDAYLLAQNKIRRGKGQRKYSFNSFALDAIKEKIARDKGVRA